MTSLRRRAPRYYARSKQDLRILVGCLLDPAGAAWSKLAFLAGVLYLFIPIDLIPDRLPVIGHLDEIGFVLAGLLGARLLAPLSFLEQTDTLAPVGHRHRAHAAKSTRDWHTPSLARQTCFALRVVRADLSNFFLWQYRSLDGFLVTGKNSGTHWLKFMLSCAIAEQFDVPAPTHSSGRPADAIIGHPQWAPRYPHLPLIGSSHTIPSIVFAWRGFTRLLPHPPVVVLVRDVREAMLSNYVKWRQRYGESFADYVHGDPLGRRHVADVWWYLHFVNRWCDVARVHPRNTLLVRYEDLQSAPEFWLRRVASHLGIPLGDDAVQTAMQFVDRAAISERLDPSYHETIIPPASERQRLAFSEEDEWILQGILRRHLRYDLGYGYPIRGNACARRHRRAGEPERESEWREIPDIVKWRSPRQH